MDFKITILSENTVTPQVEALGEHGFSVFIEGERENVLFDTGQGLAIINNSMALNKNLRSIDKIVLSHGHKDHSGGLAKVLQIKGDVEVIGHPNVFKTRYRLKKDGKKKYVGLPFHRSYLEGLGARFNLIKEFTEISKDIYVTGEVPRKTPLEKGDPDLYAEVDGKLVPDPFEDDLSLVLDTKKGMVIVLGCAHSGVINIIEHIIGKKGNNRIRGIIGGTHLKGASSEQIEWTIKELEKYSIEMLGVSHCTGMDASLILSQKFKEKFLPCNVGTVIEF